MASYVPASSSPTLTSIRQADEFRLQSRYVVHDVVIFDFNSTTVYNEDHVVDGDWSFGDICSYYDLPFT